MSLDEFHQSESFSRNENDPSLRPQSTASHFSIADEHYIYEFERKDVSNISEALTANRWAANQKLDKSMNSVDK
jgi:hypothetical protein